MCSIVALTILYFDRDKRNAALQVDGEKPVTGAADVGSTQLDTDGMLWIGECNMFIF